MPRLKNILSGVIVNVDAATAARLGSGWRPASDASESTSPAKPAKSPDKPAAESPDKSWKVADLKSFAEANGIALGEATKKDDILAVIAKPAPAEDAVDD